MAAASPPPEQLFNPTSDPDPLSELGNKFPAVLPPGPARRWLEQLHLGVRPWGWFLEPRRCGAPHSLGELGQRLQLNAQRFQGNYGLILLGLSLYCLITSPLLLAALGLFLGLCHLLRLRLKQGPLVLLGRELRPPQVFALAGGGSLPLFWLAGAGAAVFWVLGAAVLVIGSHAALRQPDPPPGTPDMEEV